MSKDWIKRAAATLGEHKFTTDSEVVDKLSKDYYWYSPILEQKLKDKLADGVVKALDEQDVIDTLSFAYQHNIPITSRGAGTGNYGQAIPLQGGILLDVSGLSEIIEIGNGYVRCQCGVKLGVLDKAVRETGQDLCIYPSTYMVATIGGFISGGSGGIGSIMHGMLWDGNVLELIAYTMEATPRRLTITGNDLLQFIHSYGTTGVITEVVIPLTPAKIWQETIVHFDNLEIAAQFANSLANDAMINKRLVSVHEWPIPSFFAPLSRHIEPNAAAVLLEIEMDSQPAVEKLIKQSGGRIGYAKPSTQYRKGISLSDFTWNHTTLWSIKKDSSYTYLQALLSRTDYIQQLHLIKSKFGEEVLIHLEWLKLGGTVLPVIIPIVYYTSEARLNEVIDYLESIEVSVDNPHTWVLDQQNRTRPEILESKKLNDPLDLLNPGKLVG
jgi:FAD/FMN-containing dehydrogenase